MRFLVPMFVFLAVSAFHTALSASLESAEKEEVPVVAQQDGQTELQKIDQIEFEAAQKNKAAQMNVTEEQNEEGRYLEAVKNGSVEERIEAGKNNTAEGVGNSDAAARGEPESESSEEADGRQRREHHEAKAETVSSSEEVIQDSTKDQDQDVLE